MIGICHRLRWLCCKHSNIVTRQAKVLSMATILSHCRKILWCDINFGRVEVTLWLDCYTRRCYDTHIFSLDTWDGYVVSIRIQFAENRRTYPQFLFLVKMVIQLSLMKSDIRTFELRITAWRKHSQFWQHHFLGVLCRLNNNAWQAKTPVLSTFFCGTTKIFCFIVYFSLRGWSHSHLTVIHEDATIHVFLV